MRTRLIAARDERRLGLRYPLERGSGLEPLDLGRIGFGADDHEVVVHHKLARCAVAIGHPGLLSVR